MLVPFPAHDVPVGKLSATSGGHRVGCGTTTSTAAPGTSPWAGSSPLRLWGTEYNERAVRFYERCGFKTTGERVVWRGKPPNVRMSCDPTLSDNLSRTTRDRIADQHRLG